MLSFQDKIKPLEKTETKGLSFMDKVKPIESPVSPTPSYTENNPVENFSQGLAKGEVSTVRGLAKFGDFVARNTVGRITNAIDGKGFTAPAPEGNILDQVNTTPEGTAQNLGFATERIAEFLLPSSGVNRVKTAATDLIKGTSFLSKSAKLATKSAIEGATVGGQTALQQGEINDDVKLNAIVSTLIPVAGSTLTKVLEKTGGKIQQSVLKPSIRDIEDGFKVENVAKYKVGGNLNQVMTKTNAKINELSQELNQKLGDSNASINLNKIYQDTAKKVLGSKLENFGDNKGIGRVLINLKEEIIEAAGENGLVSIPEAQIVKRGAGNKGSWVFGSTDPDAKASEKVYNAFYRELKTAIEKNSPDGVKEINKQLSELIPISHAVIRRIPVAERNNAISLTDSMGLYAALFDPKVLVTMGALKLSKSGRFGNLLMRAADKLKTTENPIIKRATE